MKIPSVVLYSIVGVSALLFVALVIFIIRVCARYRYQQSQKLKEFRMGGSQDKLDPSDLNYICSRTSEELMSERKELLYRTSEALEDSEDKTPQMRGSSDLMTVDSSKKKYRLNLSSNAT